MRKYIELAVLMAVVIILFLSGRPAQAASPVEDGAGIFSRDAVSRAVETAALIKRKTGKDLWIVTVPSRGNLSRKEAADQAFREREGQGIMIFIAVREKEFGIRVGNMTRKIFPDSTIMRIKNTLGINFKAGDYDSGLLSAVGMIKETFREASSGSAPAVSSARTSGERRGGLNLMQLLFYGGLILLGIFAVSFLLRAMSGKSGGGVIGGGNVQAQSGSGGGFFSGLLGGLGGAFLGNAAYDMMRNTRNDGERGIEDSGLQADEEWKNRDSGESSFSDDSGGWNDGGGADFGGGDFGGGDGGW
jgi:uncharacterized protein